MAFDVSVAMTWILFLALFPMAFFWLRRAWRILARRDFSEVALKRGDPPPDVQRWAPYTMRSTHRRYRGGGGHRPGAVGIPYDTWTAIAGSTIWIKFLLDFALSRHAHGFGARKAEGPKQRRGLLPQRLIALFALALLLFNFPLLALWDRGPPCSGCPCSRRRCSAVGPAHRGAGAA